MSSMYEINKILETSSALDVGFIPTMNSTSRRSTKVTQPNSRNSSSSIPSIASLPETSTAPNSKFSFANTGVLGPTSFLTKMRSITEDNSASTSSKMTEPTNTPGFHTSSKTFTFRDKNPTNNVSSLQSTSPSSDSKTAPKMDGTIEITSENDNMLSSSSLSEFSKLRITEDSSASTSSKMTEPTITPDSSTSKTFTFIYKSLTSNVSRVQSTSLSSDTNTAPKMDGTTEVTTLHATKSVFESSNLKNISIQSRNSTAVTKSFTREYRTELLTVSSSQNIKSIDINIFPTMGPLQTNPTLFKSATDQSIMMTNPSYPSHTSNISVPDTLSNTAPTQPISSSSKLNTSPMTMTSPGTTSDVGISPTASPASDFTISISPIHEFVRTPSKSFPTTPSLPTTLSKMVSQQTRVLPKTTTSQITKSESSHPGKNSATPAASLPSDITLDADLPTQTSIISAKHTKYKFTASENIPKTTLSTRTSLFVTRVLTNASPLTKENIALTSSKGNILSSTSLLLTPPELVAPIQRDHFKIDHVLVTNIQNESFTLELAINFSVPLTEELITAFSHALKTNNSMHAFYNMLISRSEFNDSNHTLGGISTHNLTPSHLVSLIMLCIFMALTIALLIILALKLGLFSKLIQAKYFLSFPEAGSRVPCVGDNIPTFMSSFDDTRQ
ncbi:hypothetical protein XENTR_v10011923 [Xenopus tropicalis]|nr:hypothetical protein XENTR_v10011923 [Xenopus tropicalis]